MRIRAPTLALLALTAAGPARAQEVSAPASPRPGAFVAGTSVFSLHSDPRINLHDFLIWELASDDPVDPRPECLAELPEGRATALREAGTFYEDHLARGRPDSRGIVLDLRFHLAGHPDVEIADDPEVVAEAVRHLEGALPAYRACWWADHDARNRRWIADVVPMLVAHEDSIAARLSRLYRTDWQLPIDVDVVGYASSRGANTILDPHHVMVTGVEDAFSGRIRLEILFHEASHTLMDRRRRPVARALQEAAREAGMSRPPDDLWHAVLFYTTGRTVERVLAERGVPDYRQFLYSQGLLKRAWPELREPIERHWRPYVEGEASLEEAARGLVGALRR